MSEADHTPARTDHPDEGPRPSQLGVIATDRPCASCGFNLHGQVIEREPHYRLVVARCPECGTVAALQEYPSLGRWARRWSMLLAAAWVVVLLLLTLPTAGLIGGPAASSMRGIAYAAGTRIALAQNEWLRSPEGVLARETYKARVDAGEINPARPEDPGDAVPGLAYIVDPSWAEPSIPLTVNPWRDVSARWLESRGAGTILDQSGGLGALIDTATVWSWTGQLFAAFGVGAFWAVALAGVRLWVRLLIVAIPATIGLIITATGVNSPYGIASVDPASALVQPFAVGMRMVLPFSMTIGALLASVGIVAGSLLGRPLARCVIRWALPARLAAPFGGLWSVDGKALPGPRR